MNIRPTCHQLIILPVVMCTLLLSNAATATLPYDEGAVGLAQTLKKLQTTISILHVVAHPDDEDGALMTYAARGMGWRAMLFSITRGEGGANLISSDFFDELGALRTLEHLAAAEYYGSQLFYSCAADYGYSKTLDEANRTWKNGELILKDLVEVIRRERPTILFSRFRGDSYDGHGHHQMAGVLSARAVEAAADVDQFRELGLPPWQVQKLYTNNLRPDRRSADAKLVTVQIPTGRYSPLLGRSFAQVARYGLGYQRSQGISGHEGDAGPRMTRYRLLSWATDRPLPPSESHPSHGLDRSLADLARRLSHLSEQDQQDLVEIQAHIESAVKSFNLDSPERTVPHLLRGLARARALARRFASAGPARKDEALQQQLKHKIGEFRLAIRQALGVQLQAWAIGTDKANGEFQHVTPGDKMRIQVRLVQRSALPVNVKQLIAEVPDGWQIEPAAPVAQLAHENEVLQWMLPAKLADSAVPIRQAWSRDSIADAFYHVAQDYAQRPLPAAPARVRLTLGLPDGEVVLTQTVKVRFRHPKFGNVRYPLTVVPPVSVWFPVRRGLFAIKKKSYHVDVSVRGHRSAGGTAKVSLRLPVGWQSEPSVQDLRFRKEGEESTRRFELRPTSPVAAGQTFRVLAEVEFEGRTYSEGFQSITARDLGRLNLYRDAVHIVEAADIALPLLPRVAYIQGSGDEVPAALRQLGIEPTLLNEKDLEGGRLDVFDVILVGVRAYAVREDLRRYNQRLVDYVASGGTLIVQYQTPEFDNNYGPFPYEMGRRPEEVSEENSLVTILEPQHPIFNFPNKIGPRDFAGWVEQRGSKFWSTWDDRYTPLLECHDTGQSPQRGGLMITRHGKGYYVYSAYAWYRQLPYAVPGAYRLFVNMISLGGR